MRFKVLAIALVVGSACASTQEGAGSRAVGAPDFTVTTFTGDEYRLADQRGSPVVLNFWESW